jgi:hypothetical protein
LVAWLAAVVVAASDRGAVRVITLFDPQLEVRPEASPVGTYRSRGTDRNVPRHSVPVR